MTISLRPGQGEQCVVLEVHDDGPGFLSDGGSAGTGLQNMHDRLSAVGGELVIDTRPGGGTWIRAQVTIPATVGALQPGADSLR